MDSTYELFQMDGDEDTFWQDRPDLDPVQSELLNCYYNARRDGKAGERVPREAVEYHLAESVYESDFALSILQQLDDHYLKLCADKLKRQTK